MWVLVTRLAIRDKKGAKMLLFKVKMVSALLIGLTMGLGCEEGGDSGLKSTAGPEHCGTITADEVWAALQRTQQRRGEIKAKMAAAMPALARQAEGSEEMMRELLKQPNPRPL